MQRPPASLKPFEWFLALGICLLYLLLGLHCLGNLAFFGQDFTHHALCVKHLQQNPWQPFSQDFTNRPAAYWIACLGSWLSDGRDTYPLASLIFLMLNAGALLLFFDCTRFFLQSRWLRLSCLAAAAFLPVTVISTVVFAGDATVLPPFVLMVWALLRSLHASSPAAAWRHAGLAGLALCTGMLCRFNFILIPFTLPVIAVLLGWLQKAEAESIGRTHLLRRWLLAVSLPALALGIGLQVLNSLQVTKKPDRHHFSLSGERDMSWSSLFLPKAADIELFNAPSYFDPPEEMRASLQYIPIRLVGYPCLLLEDSPLPLLTNNRYSYPMLLHLGLFTDVMDLANKGWTDRGAPRPQPQAGYARLSVRTGFVFFLLGQLAWGALVLALISRQKPPSPEVPGLLVWAVPAAAWFLSCTLVLPFTAHAYDWGYWLPRLVLPFVLTSVLLGFWLLDRWARRAHWLVPAVVLLVAAQSTLHWLSLWY